MKKVVISLLSVFLLVFVAVAEQKEELFDKVALVINSEPVLKSDLEFAKQWYNTKTDKEAEERLIESILVYQQAKKVGVSVSPKEVDQAILSIAQANGITNLKDFEERLSQEGVSYEKLKEFIKRDMITNRFLQLYFRQSVSNGVVEGELQDVKKVRMIFISKQRGDYSQVIKEISTKLNRDNFASYAKQYSDDKFTAENEGLLGDIRKGDLIKELDEEVFKHKVGDVFKVDVNDGTYFIYVEKEDRKILPKENFEKESIEKLKKDYQIYLKKLRERAVVQRL